MTHSMLQDAGSLISFLWPKYATAFALCLRRQTKDIDYPT